MSGFVSSLEGRTWRVRDEYKVRERRSGKADSMAFVYSGSM